jgi:phosphoribosylformimino-5-aminoimidazole carboxamide ribotide isomerase
LFETFTVIPSIDLKAGQVVRLLRGDVRRTTIYGSDPASIARQFEDAGARIIHIVDLDGAIEGVPRNLDSLRAIRAAVGCKLEASGGLRTIESVGEVVATGVDFLSIGSAAFLGPELLNQACVEYPGRVLGSLDIRGGQLAIKGWVEHASLSIEEAAGRFRDAGVAALIATDIDRDGTEAGVNVAAAAAIAEGSRLRVIASGGVAGLADIRASRALFDKGVVGVVVGRALYENRFTLAQAIAEAS